jgi:DNA-3-methyladenine glycosylase II
MQPFLDPAAVAAAVAHLRHSDDRMRALIDRVGPCTLHLHGDLFYALVHAIVSQQISVKAKDAIMARIRNHYAPDPFPTPDRILRTPDDDLRALGCSRAKVVYLKDLSSRIAAGSLDLDTLPALPDEQIIDTLVAVKGIGRWTAEMLLIFALGRLDVWPVDDLGIVVGVQLLHDLPDRPKPKIVQELGEPFRPYRSIASWYLWRIRTAVPPPDRVSEN